MARPKVSPSVKRSVKVTFRINGDQHERLHHQAETCGCTVGDLIRTKLFKGHFPLPRPARVDISTYAELKKIGVNLNQLARLANSGQIPFGIDKALDKLIIQEEKIISLLLNNDSQPEDR